MEFNKKTYLIIGGVLILAYIVFKKKTYIVETTPIVEPPKSIEPLMEQQEALNNPKPVPDIKPTTPIVARPTGPKSYSPDVTPAPMPQIQSIRPSFGQYGGKKI
jgi:hypothetical protein